MIIGIIVLVLIYSLAAGVLIVCLFDCSGTTAIIASFSIGILVLIIQLFITDRKSRSPSLSDTKASAPFNNEDRSPNLSKGNIFVDTLEKPSSIDIEEICVEEPKIEAFEGTQVGVASGELCNEEICLTGLKYPEIERTNKLNEVNLKSNSAANEPIIGSSTGQARSENPNGHIKTYINKDGYKVTVLPYEGPIDSLSNCIVGSADHDSAMGKTKVSLAKERFRDTDYLGTKNTNDYYHWEDGRDEYEQARYNTYLTSSDQQPENEV